MASEPIEGGCQCGAVRYRATGTPRDPHYCHCSQCRRALGAHTGAWVNFEVSGFTFTGEEPAGYRSSPNTVRTFCAKCGTSISVLDDGDTIVSVTIGSLDHPSRIAPAEHTWTASKVSWLTLNDGLPQSEN